MTIENVIIKSYMENNLVIIEVKSVRNIEKNFSNLEKDLGKILDFIRQAKYQYGIMLIYSNGSDRINNNILETFKEKTRDYSEKIFLIWHPGPEIEPIVIN